MDKIGCSGGPLDGHNPQWPSFHDKNIKPKVRALGPWIGPWWPTKPIASYAPVVYDSGLNKLLMGSVERLYLSFQMFHFNETKFITQQNKWSLQFYEFWIAAICRFLYRLKLKIAYFFSDATRIGLSLGNRFERIFSDFLFINKGK